MVELIRHRLAFELAVPLAPQEAEDVPGREIQRAVLQQAGEELRQMLGALEHQLRRVLGLGGHPVVRQRGQHVAEHRVYLTGIPIQPRHPRQADKPIGQALGPRKVLDP